MSARTGGDVEVSSARSIAGAAQAVGGLTALLVVSATLTGLWLEFFYTPDAAAAWDDIETLQNEISRGLLIRNLHGYLSTLVAISTITWLALLIGARGGGTRWLAPVAVLAGTVAAIVTGLRATWTYGGIGSYPHLLLGLFTATAAVVGAVAVTGTVLRMR